MKNFIFLICVASLIVGVSCLILYFTDYNTDYKGRISYSNKYINFFSIGITIFLFTAFYLWKNNFFKRNS